MFTTACIVRDNITVLIVKSTILLRVDEHVSLTSNVVLPVHVRATKVLNAGLHYMIVVDVRHPIIMLCVPKL